MLMDVGYSSEVRFDCSYGLIISMNPHQEHKCLHSQLTQDSIRNSNDNCT